MKTAFKAVAVGASAGGVKALSLILPQFGRGFAGAVILVQHRSEDEESWLVDAIGQNCRLKIKEVVDKEPVLPGIVYVAPAGYHLLVEKDRHFALSVDDPVCYSRPSIDVLFESAAQAYGHNLIAIILTRANSDGTRGMAAVKASGGYTIAQDPAQAKAAVMPKAAIEANVVDVVLPLEKIPLAVKRILGMEG